MVGKDHRLSFLLLVAGWWLELEFLPLGPWGLGPGPMKENGKRKKRIFSLQQKECNTTSTHPFNNKCTIFIMYP